MKFDILNIDNYFKPLVSNHYGYIYRKFDKGIFRYLKPQVDKIISDFNLAVPYQNQLAGQIYDEYKFTLPPFFIDILKDTSRIFEEEFNYYRTYHYLTNKREIDPILDFHADVWVNFQKKHEYNPLHLHRGLYSWVFWYQIPYTLESEKESKPQHPSDTREGCSHGQFNFVYPDHANGLSSETVPCHKQNEGTLLFFPSSLHHTVHPFFSSNDYRITIAGNISLSSYK